MLQSPSSLQQGCVLLPSLQAGLLSWRIVLPALCFVTHPWQRLLPCSQVWAVPKARCEAAALLVTGVRLGPLCWLLAELWGAEKTHGPWGWCEGRV